MTEAEQLYNEIGDSLLDAKKSKMFGALCLKAPNGKAFAMLWRDNYMIFKLQSPDEKEVLALDGTNIFTPMDGRPMNGWVQVPLAYADQWPRLAQLSMAFVASIPAKTPKIKKAK